MFIRLMALSWLGAGPPKIVPPDEDAPLRVALYPYRTKAKTPDDWAITTTKFWWSELSWAMRFAGARSCVSGGYGPGDPAASLVSTTLTHGRRAVIILDESIAKGRWTRGYLEKRCCCDCFGSNGFGASGRSITSAIRKPSPNSPGSSTWLKPRAGRV